MGLPYAQVLVDGFGRLGTLTYDTGQSNPSIGDAVKVPFGKRDAVGVVVELLDKPPKPVDTKPIIEVYGPRSSESDMLSLQKLSAENVSDLRWAAARLAPTHGKSAEAKSYGEVTSLAPEELELVYDKAPGLRNVILRPGFLTPELVAAHEILRIHKANPQGQVLVMCPTLFEVQQIMKLLPTGVGHLDESRDKHAWRSFCESTLKIAVTTNVGSWYAAPDLAGIVVVEENMHSHRTKTAPSIHNRDAALARADAAENITLSLITANPSPQALGMADITVLQPSLASGEAAGEIRFISEIEGMHMMPNELYSEMQNREEEFTVIYQGSSRVCARCYTRKLKDVETCTLCGFTTFKDAGVDAKTVKKVYGAAKPLQVKQVKNKRNLGKVIVPQADRLITAPTLQPGAPAVEALMRAATAAGPGGVVYALVQESVPPVLKQASQASGQLELARDYYRNAKKLKLPPFGRMFEITVRDDKPWDVSKFPGYVNGPKKTKAGQSIIVRCDKSQTVVVRTQIERLRKDKRKVGVREPV